MNFKKFIMTSAVITAILLGSTTKVGAQQVGIKSNLLSDIALSPNLGLEIGLAPKWTFNLAGQLNLWTVDNRKWKHYFVEPEFRYWFCERFAGHFIGIHGIGGQYNFGNLNIPYNLLGSNLRELKDKRYQGWAAGAGFDYGYAWPVHKHWNIEAVLGIGWIYTRYDSYPCAECGSRLKDNKPHNYFGLTKLEVNIEYLF